MTDVIVVGAGAAGLRVAGELRRNGFSVSVLEASKRIGGRVRTLHDDSFGVPLELGAEFVHGEAKATYKLLAAAGLVTVKVLGQHFRSRAGKFEDQERVWKRIGRVFKRMDPDREEDRPFEDFLHDKPGGPFLKEERELARGFVQGFNAADTWRISEKSLAEQGDPTEGAAHAARIINGYDALIDYLAADVIDVVQFESFVSRILWDEGRVQVFTKQGAQHEARAVVVTVPLPFLQDDSISFEPEITSIREAARLLVMGDVARVNVVVRERFWEKKHADLSFLHAPERPFNVWWTLYPLKAPVLVGWSGGPPAAQLNRGDVEAAALHELARAFGLRRARLEQLVAAVHTHDWTNDPFARGAYSYTGVGGSTAPQRLTRPVQGTIFIAGEATDSENAGTVEAAIASGERAFRQIVKALA